MRFFLLFLFIIPSVCFADSQSENTIGGYTASPHIIQSSGVSLSPRPYLDFEGITCVNTGVKTVCTGGSGGSSVGNLDGGNATSTYNAITPIDGGGA